MQSTLERRQEILETLLLRRRDTVPNLACEFGVSKNTIRRDLCILCRDYPIETVSGKNGGVRLPDGYYAVTPHKRLTEEQFAFLERLASLLSPSDKKAMQEILLILRST